MSDYRHECDKCGTSFPTLMQKIEHHCDRVEALRAINPIREDQILKKLEETLTHLKKVAQNHAERLMELNNENAKLKAVADAAASVVRMKSEEWKDSQLRARLVDCGIEI